ncbi:hypothetical protein KsCSTR_31960 [Candidatus Kuenenia stuttgartiensis]|uniref:Uncharacterized protein n=1 Tax=Kuenenia stuttgartiensis TaxID=174633 RepID=Q1Q4T8_KUEST|nr:hypothetical protein KsCSTR_31960 [Candidatus Kuenenia stuttgartiensis]CAJ75032.1 unknown protein [Candidatus Kuenenia stuttgartiensis]
MFTTFSFDEKNRYLIPNTLFFRGIFFQRRKNIIISVTSLLYELFFRHIPKKHSFIK